MVFVYVFGGWKYLIIKKCRVKIKYVFNHNHNNNNKIEGKS